MAVALLPAMTRLFELPLFCQRGHRRALPAQVGERPPRELGTATLITCCPERLKDTALASLTEEETRLLSNDCVERPATTAIAHRPAHNL